MSLHGWGGSVSAFAACAELAGFYTVTLIDFTVSAHPLTPDIPDFRRLRPLRFDIISYYKMRG